MLFEAAGRITDIREVDYRNVNGVAGVRTRVGGGKPFSVHADFGNVAFKPDDPALQLHRFDVLADVSVPTLPDQLDVCFRQADPKAIAPLTTTFTAPCETQNPFGDPQQPHVVAADVRLSRQRPCSTCWRAARSSTAASASATRRSATTTRSSATANVYNLPKKLTLDVQAPEKGKDGPIRALFRTRIRATRRPARRRRSSIDADFQQYDADLVCKDPRVPGVGDQVMCIRARPEEPAGVGAREVRPDS